MNVLERENLTKYEVHLKIDNLNVEDMFDHNRTEKLLDIFRSVAKLLSHYAFNFATLSVLDNDNVHERHEPFPSSSAAFASWGSQPIYRAARGAAIR